jgi:hypothetical protein
VAAAPGSSRPANYREPKGQVKAGTLGIYVQLGEETSARITAENDEHHRQRH